MEFLVLWLATSVASFVMEIANELRMFKDVADVGYKIDTKRLAELGKQLNPNATKVTLLSMLIPILNIAQVLQRTVQYNNVRPMVLDSLRVMDTLEEMSESEKEEYLKKPTGLNAFLIPLKLEIRLARATSIKFNDGNKDSEIFYEGKSLDDITILKVNGPASKLTVEEQKEKVIDAWKDFVELGMEKYGDEQGLINALKNSPNLNLTATTDDTKDQEVKEEEVVDEVTTTKSMNKLSISEQKEALEKFKNELLGEQNSEQKSQMNSGSAYTKGKR